LGIKEIKSSPTAAVSLPANFHQATKIYGICKHSRTKLPEKMIALQSPSSSNHPGDRFKVLGVSILLVMGVLLIFGRVHGYEFVNFDDDQYYSANYHVQSGLTGNGVVWAFRTGYASNWHPLTWLSLMLDAQLFGTGPGGPHLTNVLLHAANTVLLFLLLKRLTKSLWPSAFVAAVFAVHPLHVESVAWVSERKDVLSGLFFMLTLLMYMRYGEEAKIKSSKAKTFYIMTFLFFALGLMSKPMLVTVPFVLLLLDYWPLQRISGVGFQVSSRRLILEKIPLFVLSAVSCLVTVLAQREVIQQIVKLPLPARFGNALISYVTYLVQMVWPQNLVVYYPYRLHTPAWQIVVAGVVLFSMTLMAFQARHQSPYFVVGWLWYLGMLAPVIGLVQVGSQAHADRYTYLPQIGLYFAIALAIRDWTASWRWRCPVLGVGTFVMLTTLIACTWKQTSFWRNDKSLWEHAIACTSNNVVAYNNLGYMLIVQGQTAKAVEYFQKALEIDPNYAEAHNNLGEEFFRGKRYGEAIEHFRRAIAVSPDFAEAHNNLASVLFNQGKLDEAIEQYQKAIQLNPDFAGAHNNLGEAFRAQGRLNEAIDEYQQAIAIKPDYVIAHDNLASALFTQGKLDEASKELQRTLELVPNSVHVHYQLGLVLQSSGRFAAAVGQFQKILELDSRHVAAQNNLAWLLATCPDSSVRNGSKAVEAALRAVELSGGETPEILDTLAAAYAEAGRFPEAVATANRAFNLAIVQNNTPLVGAIQGQLKFYEAGMPFRDISTNASH
jgi:tetratricopeptide (TPR) repeat protein